VERGRSRRAWRVDPYTRAFPFERRFEVLDGLGEHVVVAGREREFRDEGHGWGLFVDGGPRSKNASTANGT